MSPVLAALLFHAPGLRWLANHRLSRNAARLNIAVLALTLLAIVLAKTWFGYWGAVIAFAIGHTAWSITLAVLVSRGHSTLIK